MNKDEELERVRTEALSLLDEARNGIVAAIHSVEDSLNTSRHKETISRIESFTPSFRCEGDELYEIKELLSKLFSLFLLSRNDKFMSKAATKTIKNILDGYDFLIEIECRNPARDEKYQIYIKIKHRAEVAIDVIAGLGLQESKGKLTLSRSLRRWWNGALYSE